MMLRPPTPTPTPTPTPQISIIAPAHNEQDNVAALVDEVQRALEACGCGLGGVVGVGGVVGLGGVGVGVGGYEFIIVDDGSTDQTRARVHALMSTRPWLRCIAMQRTPPGKGHGQSAAFCAGFRAARAPLIGTLDADLQNDPADFPRLLATMRETHADLVQGDRSAARRDNWVRRRTSAIGRLFRRMILGDRVRDTGCSLRLMRAEIARRLPMEFKGAHRFIPALAGQMGYTVVEMPVNHRPRVAGKTKYGLGIWQRALPGLMDCFAVRWMGQRRRPVEALEVVGGVGVMGGPSATAAAPTMTAFAPTVQTPESRGTAAGARP